jgi:CheY-like chemotaxis protein
MEQAPRIMVVDDEAGSREALAGFLERQGHEVCTAADGVEGLRVADRFRPEIVFLDLDLPRMDGFELCARLRANHEMEDATLFALTAPAYPKSAAANPSGGPGFTIRRFDAVLTKPVEFDVVSGLVSSVVSLSR